MSSLLFKPYDFQKCVATCSTHALCTLNVGVPEHAMIPIALRVAHLCPNWSYEVRQRIAMFLTMLPLLLVPSEERFSRRSTPKPPTCICSLAHHYCLWSIAISIALVFRGHWCQRNHCSSTKTCTFSVRVKNTCLELVFQTFWFGYRLGNIFHACALLVECCLSG